MPATSEARIAANRSNALKSTGPRTPEGKERSRRNGLKHGLTGRGVVVPAEDAPEVERRSHALMTELAPKSALGVILVGQLATLSVRMERAADREEEVTAKRVRHAPEAFDRERVEAAEDLFAGMMRAEDPRPWARELRRSPEGVDRLMVGWADARVALTHPPLGGWSSLNLPITSKLVGVPYGDPAMARPTALLMAAMGAFERLGPGEGEGLDDDARRRWAVDRLVEWVDAEVAVLEAHRATLDFETIELDRAGSAVLALYDDSPEATRARRYESEARRGFFRSLREFRRVEAEAPEAPVEAAPEVGSSWEGASATAPSPREAPPEAAPGLVKPCSAGENLARGLDGRVVTVGRAHFAGG